jgi:hypothetical protein
MYIPPMPKMMSVLKPAVFSAVVFDLITSLKRKMLLILVAKTF